MTSEAESARSEEFEPRVGAREEQALAECIERMPREGPGCVDAVCGSDSDLAQRVRARMARLSRLGLLEVESPPVAVLGGRYRLDGVVGRGGMGTVYLAHDLHLARCVALKISHAPLFAEGAAPEVQRARERFEREVQAARRLSHPAVVALLDAGTHEGRPYFTMEYVRGTTLARVAHELASRGVEVTHMDGASLRALVIELGPVGAHELEAPAGWGRTYVECICRWMIEIAQALEHAHGHGVVHRDVKPSNILVRADGRAQLFDLGLARLADQPSLTRTGEFAGSPYYAAPEQLEGSPDELDSRCDVYALGVTLYELLALRRPFEGASAEQVFRRIVRGEYAPLRRVQPAVSPDLETVCATAMERDCSRRYASAREFADDLRRLLELRPIRAQSAGWARRVWRQARRRPALASALALGATLLVALPVGLSIANRAIRLEQSRAEREARDKAAVTQFLIDHFRLTESERRSGGAVSARELLDRAVARLSQEFDHDPRVRAELLAATGEVYANLGQYERAIEQLDRALALRQSAATPVAQEIAATLGQLARAHLELGDAQVARSMCQRALELAAQGGAEELSAQLEFTAADAACALGSLDEAQAALDSAARRLEAEGGGRDQGLAALELRRARLEVARNDLDAARTRYAKALEFAERAWTPEVATLELVLEEFAGVCEQRGERDDAQELRRRARALAAAELEPSLDAPEPFVLAEPWLAEFEREFQRGVTSLQARDYAAASEAFLRCGQLDASDPVCAYNLACARSLAGDVESGLAALWRASELGFGGDPARVRVAQSDPDIEPLRSDPRGAKLLERLGRDGEQAQQRLGSALHAPPAALASGPAPLLVVLHAEGRSMHDVAHGAWRSVAEQLGAHLLAPNGPIALGASPAQASAWFRRSTDLGPAFASTRERLALEVERVLAAHPIDRSRIWIAGEGLSAAAAFDAAANMPGLFRAVLLADGPFDARANGAQVRRAASVGLELLGIVGPRAANWAAARAAPDSVAQQGDALAHSLREWMSAHAFSPGYGHSGGERGVRVLGPADDLHRVAGELLIALAR